MQHHMSFYIFFFSLTTDVHHSSQNPPVPAAYYINGVPEDDRIPGVRIHNFFVFGCLSIPFRLQSMTTLNECGKCGSSSLYEY